MRCVIVLNSIPIGRKIVFFTYFQPMVKPVYIGVLTEKNKVIFTFFSIFPALKKLEG